jgi:hypothetical protein
MAVQSTFLELTMRISQKYALSFKPIKNIPYLIMKSGESKFCMFLLNKMNMSNGNRMSHTIIVGVTMK